MERLNKEPKIGSLILEIKDKKQYINNLEEKLKIVKSDFKQVVAAHQDTIRLKEIEITELKGFESYNRAQEEMEHGVIEI